jgi:hypothetical protein
MGLITGLVTLPLTPVRGVIWLAEQVQDYAERELYDPGRILRELERIADARQAGELTGEEADAREDELVRLLSAAMERQR